MSNVRPHKNAPSTHHAVNSHQPAAYRCPFCNILAGGEDERLFVLRDSQVAAVLSLHQQAGNPGALLLFPVRHLECIYSIPEELGAPLFNATKRLAIALKDALACKGVQFARTTSRRATKTYGTTMFTSCQGTRKIVTTTSRAL